MNFAITPRSVYAALILLLSAWVLRGFVEALLAACVIAVASWPLYRRFAACLARRVGRTTTTLLFTCLITVFVLGPLVFAVGALLAEAHVLLARVLVADQQGIAVPGWLDGVPLAGTWLASRWEGGLARPGALSLWAQGADPAALLPLAQFTLRHGFIVLFTILLLSFLYQQGESLARALRQLLRERVGERAERYLGVATQAVRASVNSILLVGLFDGCAAGLAYAFAGVEHAALWGAITGTLAIVPFLGYLAVFALTLQLAVAGTAAPALVSLLSGCLILFIGDKVVRPAIARNGTHLPFAWVLMGCLGGFQAMGLVGLVVGPVALTLGREVFREAARP